MSMTRFGGQEATRVLLRQALGGDEFLRVTWHERNDVFVFSHWEGDTCAAATPVRVTEMGDLATMMVTALGRHLAQEASPWPAPSPSSLVSSALMRLA
jgi:Ser/Thr protein kinase RdoA (MazF antagonist)